MEKRKGSRESRDGPRAKRVKPSSSQESSAEDDPDASQQNDLSSLQHDGDHGIIEKIYLRNFMCHGRLEFQFGPNVNFVVGRNGSGKSAIMTGLVVGLGGKASATSRGSSVKSFIKTGKTNAEIAIILRNRGTDAYRYDKYGQTIRIERKINSDGTTSYKMKSHKGQVIETKREELSRILDQFNIQVDNPVSILNQDTSRNFLFTKDPRDKYKFFMKATQLEQIETDYALIQEQKTITEDKIAMKEEGLPDLEKDALAKEQRFKDIESLNTLREKKEQLIKQLAWAHVATVEKELDDIAKILQQEESRLPKFEAKVDESQVKVQQAEASYNAVKQKITELTKQMEELQPQLDVAKAAMMESKKTTREIDKHIRLLQQGQGRDKHDKRDCEKKIDELKQTAQRDYEKERKDREDKTLILIQQKQEREACYSTTNNDFEQFSESVDRAQRDYEKERKEREEKTLILIQQKQEREARYSTTDNDFKQFSDAVDRARQRNYELRNKVQDTKNLIDQGMRRINELEKSRSNRLRLYGSSIPALAEKIKKTSDFHREPKGPLGMYLKVQDIRWALGVECVMKGLVYFFCCHDHHDATILKRLIAQVTPKGVRTPGIIISKFEDHKYDISQGMIQSSEYPSFLDIVTVNDSVIYNCLIDQRAVERVLLIEDKEAARNFLRFRAPQNCKEAFTLEGDQIYAGSDQRYYSSMQRKVRVLQADVAHQLSDTKNEVANHRREEAELNQSLRQLHLEDDSNKKQLQRLNQQRRELQNHIGQLQDEIQELQSVEDVAPVDVSALEEEVRQLEEQIRKKDEEIAAKKEVIQGANQELTAKKAENDRLNAILGEQADRVEPFKHELQTNGMNVEKSKHERKHYEGKKKEQLTKMEELRKRIDKKQQDVDADTGKAKQISPERVKTNRKPHNISNEIEQMTKRIDKEQETRGDPMEITRAFDQAREKFLEAGRQIRKWKAIIKKLESMLEIRQQAFVQLRHFIALRTKYYFTLMLSQRKYNGKIKFDHKEEALLLEILQEMLERRKAGYVKIRAHLCADFRMRFIELMNMRRMDCRLQVDHVSESIEFQVQPTESHRQNKSKDMRALSGGERSFATVCFIMALWESMEAPFRALDEFDVFMDMINRKIVMELLLQVAKDLRHRQFIFLTPQDMSKITASPLIRIVRLNDPERNQSTLPYRRRGEEEEDEEAASQNTPGTSRS